MEKRLATPEDLEHVRTWLQQEFDEFGESFIVNFILIEEGQRDDRLFVLVDEIPIAFALEHFDPSLRIIAVKPDRRSHDVGTELAEYWFQKLRDQNQFGFEGECFPTTSLPFWKKMGCTQIASRNGSPYVIMPFRKINELPEGVKTIHLSFQLYDAHMKAIPGWDYLTVAVIEPGDYMLAQDFVAYAPDSESRLGVLRKGEPLCAAKVSEIDKIGGERSGSWIRVRNLMFDESQDECCVDPLT